MLPTYSSTQQYHTNDQNGIYYNTDVVKYHIVIGKVIFRSLSSPPQISPVNKTILLKNVVYNQLPSLHCTVYLSRRLIRTYIEIDTKINNNLMESSVTKRCTEHQQCRELIIPISLVSK
jgi:hypothetical protein